MRADERTDPFTDADEAVLVEAWTGTIPSNSPYYVKFPYLPRDDSATTSTVVVRLADTTSSPNPDSDTWLDEANPTTNYGSDTTVLMGTTAGGLKGRAAFHFDLSALSGTVRRAYLRTYLETAGGTQQSIGVHALTAALTEGTATWNNMAANHNLVAADVKNVNGQGYYTWDVTSLVASWVAGTATNYGLMLKNASEATVDTRRTFSSRNHATSAQRPLLVIFIEGTRFNQVADSITPVSMEVAINYERGWMRFNSAQAGLAISFDFYDTGAPPDVADMGQLANEVDESVTTDLNVLSGTTTISTPATYANVYVAPGATLTIAVGYGARLNVAGDFELFGSLNIDGKGGAGGAIGMPGNGFGHMGGRSVVSVSAAAVYPGFVGGIRYFESTLIGGGSTWNLYCAAYVPDTNFAAQVNTDIFGGFLSASQVTALAAYATAQSYTTGGLTIPELAAWAANNLASGGAGAGGGGNLTAGSAGTGTGAGSGGEAAPYNDTFTTKFVHPLPGGGGGGSSTAAGGAGGGAILVQVGGLTYLDPAATIYARGAAAGGTNAGGGAGGAVRWRCNRIERNSVTPVVTGGAGNGLGGNGAAGWFVFENLEP